MPLSDKLIRLRNATRLSQSQIAHLVGVNATTYGDWESGHTKPKLDQYLKLAQALNVPVSDLLPEELVAAVVAETERKNGVPLMHSPHEQHFKELAASLKESLRAKDELIANLRERNQRLEAELKKLGGGKSLIDTILSQ